MAEGLDLGVSGLASGFDWRSLIDQLADVERAPQRRLLPDQQTLAATSDVSGVILGDAAFPTLLKAGTFTINGEQITVATTDTLDSVFQQIFAATGGDVAASYDPTTDRISLTSASSSEIVLGSATDTSNFLQATGLTSGSLVRGKDLLYTLDGAEIGRQLTEQENQVQASRSRLIEQFIAMEQAQSRINQQLQFLQQRFGT